MAYAFNQINDLMNQGQTGSNIFTPAGGASPAGGDTGASQPVTKTTDNSAQLSTGGGGASSAPSSSGSTQAAKPVSADVDLSNQSANKAALSANSGKTQTPGAFQNIQDQIKQNSQKAQDEANAYASGGGLSDADKGYANAASSGDTYKLEQAAIGGNQDAFKAAQGALTRGPVVANAYTPTTSTHVGDTDLLNTNAGLGQIFSRGKDPGFNKGMAAFDVASAQRNPNFQNLIQSIQGNQAAADKTAADFASTAQSNLSTKAQANLAAQQDQLKGFLASDKSNLQGQAQQAADNANAGLQNIRTSGLSAQDRNTQIAAIMAQAKQLDPTFNGQFDPNALNLGDYTTVGNNYNANDFITAPMAQQFNGINQLLGNGQVAIAGTGAQGPGYQVNTDAAAHALLAPWQAKRDQQQAAEKAALKAQADRDAAYAQAHQGLVDAPKAAPVAPKAPQYVAGSALSPEDALIQASQVSAAPPPPAAAPQVVAAPSDLSYDVNAINATAHPAQKSFLDNWLSHYF